MSRFSQNMSRKTMVHVIWIIWLLHGIFWFFFLYKLILPHWICEWTNENFFNYEYNLSMYVLVMLDALSDNFLPVSVYILFGLGQCGDPWGQIEVVDNDDIIEIMFLVSCMIWSFSGICSVVCRWNIFVILLFV